MRKSHIGKRDFNVRAAFHLVRQPVRAAYHERKNALSLVRKSFKRFRELLAGKLFSLRRGHENYAFKVGQNSFAFFFFDKSDRLFIDFFKIFFFRFYYTELAEPAESF